MTPVADGSDERRGYAARERLPRVQVRMRSKALTAGDFRIDRPR